jgi:cyclophilin family peptidyl-prolyl cis-trans isomerase
MAGIDVKGVFKDNAKLFLSILGILILTFYIGVFGGPTLNVDLPSADNSYGPAVNSDNSEENVVTAINNGNANKYTSPPSYSLKSGVDYTAEIRTSLGLIEVDLYEGYTPNTVNSFVFLANERFYDGTSFHKIIQNFIIQGGDPQGDGFGSPGYTFADEIKPDIRVKAYSLAMANNGANSNGSQFFIVSRTANTASLDGLYTVFGEVTDGFTVVDAIETATVKADAPNQFMPYSPVHIVSIRVVEK